MFHCRPTYSTRARTLASTLSKRQGTSMQTSMTHTHILHTCTWSYDTRPPRVMYAWYNSINSKRHTHTHTCTRIYTHASGSWHRLEQSGRKVTFMILIGFTLAVVCEHDPAGPFRPETHDGRWGGGRQANRKQHWSNRLIFLQAALHSVQLSFNNDRDIHVWPF